MVLVDTNIIIDHLRSLKNEESHLSAIFASTHETVGISVITIQELYAGRSTQLPIERKKLLKLLELFEIIPYTFDIAQRAGELIRDARQTCTFVDAAIVATALTQDSELVSLDKKLYSISPRIKVYSLIT